MRRNSRFWCSRTAPLGGLAIHHSGVCPAREGTRRLLAGVCASCMAPQALSGLISLERVTITVGAIRGMHTMLRKPSPPGVSEDGGSEHSREIPLPIHPHRQSLQFDPAADPTDDHTDCRSRSIGYASGRVEMIPESLFFCNWSCVVLSRSEKINLSRKAVEGDGH